MQIISFLVELKLTPTVVRCKFFSPTEARFVSFHFVSVSYAISILGRAVLATKASLGRLGYIALKE